MKRICILLLLSICPAAAAFAQNSLTVDSPSVVSTDENFRIVFTADGKMSDFNWPGSENFTILWGPQAGSMSSTSIINGKRTSTHQETRTFIVQAVKAGKFSLPAATAVIGKTEYTTGAFTIEVVGDASSSAANVQDPQSQENAGNAASSGARQGAGTSAAAQKVSGKDVFLSLTVNKSSVVKGEPLTATLKLYTRTDIEGFEDVKFPSFDGFWSKETASPQNIEFNRENVGGVIYNSALLRKYMLIPQHTGRVVIEPAEMVCLVRLLSSNPSPSSFFDSFFDSYQTVRKRLSTPEVVVNVKTLPSGAPISFCGGVGDFKMSVEQSREDLKSHEAASIIVKITGRGNISMLEAPHLDFPPDFEVYDVKTAESISSDGTSGTKTFEFPFIPRSHGEFTIPAVQYSYYDINKGRYATLVSAETRITVAKGEEVDGGGVVTPGVSRHGVKNLAEDIRFIVTSNSGLGVKGRFFAGSALFWGLAAAIIAAFFVASRALRRIEVRRRDVVGSRNRKANKMARGRLKVAGDYLKKSLNSAYYEELHKAVMGYVSDKLSIPPADLSKDAISSSLLDAGVDQPLIDSLLHIIDACEFARYAPETGREEKEGLYNEAISVISSLEGKVKRKSVKRKAVCGTVVALLSLCAAANASAAEAGSLWDEASAQYTAGDYVQALATYKAIEDMGLVSPDLYYNIANCWFKTGDNPHAILYYERCLKMDPSHGDALHNVAVAREFTLDKIDEIPQFVLVTWIGKAEYLLPADGWAVVALCLMALTAALMLGFKYFRLESGRRASFTLACVMFALAIGATAFSLDEKGAALRQDGAVILQPVATVRSSPGDAGKSIFVLHEGTTVKVLDNLGQWLKIELSDGRQGWIEAESLDFI